MSELYEYGGQLYFGDNTEDDIELGPAPAPKQETPRSASVQASGHEVPPGSLAESAQETPAPAVACKACKGTGDFTSCFGTDPCPTCGGTGSVLVVAPEPASAAFSDSEQLDWLEKNKNSASCSLWAVQLCGVRAAIDAAMRKAGLTPAATPPPSEDAKCLLRLAEAGEYYSLITPEWVAELRAIAGRIRGAATSERDALIEQCAKIADMFLEQREMVGDQSGMDAALRIGRDIRALKGGSHA